MTPKILIVEDNPQNLKVAMMALRPGGYEFVQAVDGEEAVRVAIEEKPDLILMDIQLPKMNGLEATRRLRQEPGFEDTPIIALTAYAMKGDEEKTREAGCNSYLSKPVNTRELRDVVAKTLADSSAK
jgi:CheY-like chemotaxis protein